MCEVAVIPSSYFTKPTVPAILFQSIRVTDGERKDKLSEMYSGHQHAESNVQQLNKVQLFFGDILQHL